MISFKTQLGNFEVYFSRHFRNDIGLSNNALNAFAESNLSSIYSIKREGAK